MMITMNEFVDLRMQQHIAQEIYRQQIMQRIPDPFPTMLPIPMPRHVIMPPRVTLPGVEVTLQNDDLWKQFHQIGTEMIITKSGRRMFPSMRLSLSGLEEESNYCVLLEMVPIGDCRYKFSGSQWVPAGGAEPQSPQRMYLHPDSPASGSHWQAQPILFNKVKLTNNTLDNNGHVVLASMHKYQPRIHVIRTSDLTQIPWAPQQAVVFPETEFVAVTAYQNDRITKLKIDNNPFAKGFRETGQSRCKRKMSSSPEDQDHHDDSILSSSPTKSTAAATSSAGDSVSAAAVSDKQLHHTTTHHHHHHHHHQQQQQQQQEDDRTSTTSSYDGPNIKRMRSNGSACSISSLDEGGFCSASSSGTSSPNVTDNTATPPQLRQQNNSFYAGEGGGASNFLPTGPVTGATASRNEFFMHHLHQNMQSLLRPSLVDLACTYFGRPQPTYPVGAPHHVYPTSHIVGSQSHLSQHHHHQHQHHHLPHQMQPFSSIEIPITTTTSHDETSLLMIHQKHSPELPPPPPPTTTTTTASVQLALQLKQETPPKRNNFSISAILGSGS